METDWDLENWLLEAGEQIEQKLIAGEVLSPAERLIREFWLFDIQTQNGGVSQFFCNEGLAQWQALKEAWLPHKIPSLEPILKEVDRVIFGASDPYLAALDASPNIEEFYDAHQQEVRRELRQLALGDTPAVNPQSPA